MNGITFTECTIANERNGLGAQPLGFTLSVEGASHSFTSWHNHPKEDQAKTCIGDVYAELRALEAQFGERDEVPADMIVPIRPPSLFGREEHHITALAMNPAMVTALTESGAL